ncbi:hypothetical protein [Streptomyces niveus]|uniref:hypothetical protein n=1 Tax=Streptomyces niveus TaxID=193462 RepID=UPI0036D2605A
MAARKPAARKKTTATRRKKPVRKSQVRKPARGGLVQRGLLATALKVGEYHEQHGQTVMSRRDAAILRYTHEGCPTCKGNGQIFTKGKDGSFTGSKPCPAKPTKARAGRLRVALSARFSGAKATGLCGVTCPCGWKEKPRYRDAKAATAALRTHERKKHGGKTVGGRWYAQVAEGAQSSAAPVKETAAVTKADTSGTTMTDAEWEKQNKPLSPKAAAAKGVCWCCGGNGALYSAFGGERITAVCPPCKGTGKPSTTHQPANA